MKNIGIITGASSGMGREFVLQLDQCLQSVDELWVIARRSDKLEQLKQEVTGSSLRILSFDLCQEQDLNSLEILLKKQQPKVRILVNCAGVGYAGNFRDLSRKEIIDMVTLNVRAITDVTYMVLPYMTRPSNIIQLSSASAFLPQKEFAVYAATKSYVLNFSRALREELRKSGIKVTVVCPGPVDTEFLKICNKGKKQKILKRLTTVKANYVVHKALRDAKQGKTLSIYGLPMKAVYFISHFLK